MQMKRYNGFSFIVELFLTVLLSALFYMCLIMFWSLEAEAQECKPIVSSLRTSLPQTELLFYLLHDNSKEKPIVSYDKEGREIKTFPCLGWVVVDGKKAMLIEDYKEGV